MSHWNNLWSISMVYSLKIWDQTFCKCQEENTLGNVCLQNKHDFCTNLTNRLKMCMNLPRSTLGNVAHKKSQYNRLLQQEFTDFVVCIWAVKNKDYYWINNNENIEFTNNKSYYPFILFNALCWCGVNDSCIRQFEKFRRHENLISYRSNVEEIGNIWFSKWNTCFLNNRLKLAKKTLGVHHALGYQSFRLQFNPVRPIYKNGIPYIFSLFSLWK